MTVSYGTLLGQDWRLVFPFHSLNFSHWKKLLRFEIFFSFRPNPEEKKNSAKKWKFATKFFATQKEIHLKLHFELSFESDQWFRAWEKKVDEKVFCNQQKTRFKLVPDRTNTLHWRSSIPEFIGLEAPLSRAGDVVRPVQLLTTELSSNPDQVL